MTLIAIATFGDSVEFVTDSLSYTRNLEMLSTTTKSLVLPHIDAAVLALGDGGFNLMARTLLANEAGLPEINGFDALLVRASEELPGLWRETVESANGYELYPSSVFLTGYSAAAEAFVAYELSTESGFEPEVIEGLYLHPAPWSIKPSKREAERILAEYADVDDDRLVALFDGWLKGETFTGIPGQREYWVGVAEAARTRTHGEFARTLVGGSVYITRLQRGNAQTVKLMEFDDTGEDLLRLVGFSRHPAAQERPCWCDSGLRHIDCHLADELDEPCLCGQSLTAPKTFRECCAVSAKGGV